jgi:hypothetical protein
MTEVEYSSFQGLLNTTVASIDLSDMKLKNPYIAVSLRYNYKKYVSPHERKPYGRIQQ